MSSCNPWPPSQPFDLQCSSARREEQTVPSILVDEHWDDNGLHWRIPFCLVRDYPSTFIRRPLLVRFTREQRHIPKITPLPTGNPIGQPVASFSMYPFRYALCLNGSVLFAFGALTRPHLGPWLLITLDDSPDLK